MPKLAIGDHVLGSIKFGHIDEAFAVLIVPSIRREVTGLPKVHGVAGDWDHFIGGEVNPLLRMRWHTGAARRRMQRRPVLWRLDQMQRRLAEQDRRCLEMDALVLESHKEGPEWVVLVYQHTIIAQSLVRLDGMDDSLIHLLSVFVHLSDRGPEHVVLVHVVPKHLINAYFENRLEVGVDGLVQDARDSKFVDVQTGRVAVVEYLRMAQSVNWRAVERVLPLEPGKHGFVQRPGVVKVFLGRSPGHVGQVGEGQRTEGAIGAETGTVRRMRPGPPVIGSRSGKPGIDLAIVPSQIDHPLLLVGLGIDDGRSFIDVVLSILTILLFKDGGGSGRLGPIFFAAIAHGSDREGGGRASARRYGIRTSDGDGLGRSSVGGNGRRVP